MLCDQNYGLQRGNRHRDRHIETQKIVKGIRKLCVHVLKKLPFHMYMYMNKIDSTPFSEKNFFQNPTKIE